MKTALITGANRGIGLEFVRQLKEKGYYIFGCLSSSRNGNRTQALADEVFQLDVTNDNEIASLKQKLNNRPD